MDQEYYLEAIVVFGALVEEQADDWYDGFLALAKFLHNVEFFNSSYFIV